MRNPCFHTKFLLTKNRIFWYYSVCIFGAMAERLKAAVLKTVVPRGTGGSNPSRSAIKMFAILCRFRTEFAIDSGAVRERPNRAPC